MRTVAAKDLTIGICHPVYQIEPVVKESYDETKKIGFGASTRF